MAYINFRVAHIYTIRSRHQVQVLFFHQVLSGLDSSLICCNFSGQSKFLLVSTPQTGCLLREPAPFSRSAFLRRPGLLPGVAGSTDDMMVIVTPSVQDVRHTFEIFFLQLKDPYLV